MKHNSPNSQNQSKQKKRGAKSSLIVIFMCAFIIIAFAFVVANFDSLVGESSDEQTGENTVGVAVTDENGGNSGSSSYTAAAAGFPVSFAGNSIRDAAAVGSHVFVLSKDMLSCINSSGRAVYTQKLNFVDPVMKYSGNYCLVYDRLGSRYTVFDKNSAALSGQTEEEGQIITGTVSDNGNFAISSRRSGSTSMLTYYSKSGDALFQWLCANEHIVSIGVSSGGKSLACAAINSINAQIHTNVYYFDINSSENNKRFELESAALDIFFATDSRIITVCNDCRVMIDCKDETSNPVTMNFSSTLLARANDERGNTAVVVKKIDSFNTSQLTLYDKKNNLVFSCDIDDDVIGIACENARTYVLSSDKITVYNSSGNEKGTIETDSATIGLSVRSGNVYHYSQRYLFK